MYDRGMLSILAATVLALLAMLGPYVVIETHEGPFGIYDSYGDLRLVDAATFCAGPGYLPMIVMTDEGLPLDVLAHELAHAYDCIDNGVMDGSPIERPAMRPAWTTEYCWMLHSEFFACSAQRGAWRP